MKLTTVCRYADDFHGLTLCYCAVDSKTNVHPGRRGKIFVLICTKKKFTFKLTFWKNRVKLACNEKWNFSPSRWSSFSRSTEGYDGWWVRDAELMRAVVPSLPCMRRCCLYTEGIKLANNWIFTWIAMAIILIYVIGIVSLAFASKSQQKWNQKQTSKRNAMENVLLL